MTALASHEAGQGMSHRRGIRRPTAHQQRSDDRAGERLTPPVAVCRLADLVPERGVAGLVGGRQVALFLTGDGAVHAVGNHDPFSRANVIARGLVGTSGDRWFVASPMYKHRFDLLTGACLDQPERRLPVHEVQVVDGVVLVGPPLVAGGAT
jgi:nitrite reductase (NADH) small subunit